MAAAEATARIKISKLREAAGRRLFDEDDRPTNVCLEPHCSRLTKGDVEAFGNDDVKVVMPSAREGGDALVVRAQKDSVPGAQPTPAFWSLSR